MYLDHFGLTEAPFRITPHTDFFFAGANRGSTLDALIYAITHDEGIVKVSGEVGSGKTMLCRVLMERLPEHVTIVYLANPSLSREDILFAIVDELGIPTSEGARASAVLRTLQEHLVKLYGDGRQVVVLIDEAHAMPAETLEEIRLLSNLESNRHKLLQLVMFGQPELNEVLARPDMRQLKERITHNFTLEPLVRDDIAQYLDFRMRAAGYHGPEVFSAAAVKLIAGASEGLTRRINILADKALLAAFAAGTHQIKTREAKAAIRDSEFAQTMAGASKQSRRYAAMAMGLGVVAAVAFFAARLGHESAATQPAQPATPIAPAPADSPLPAGATLPAHANAAAAPAAPSVPATQGAVPTAASSPNPTVATKIMAAEPTAFAATDGDAWPELGPATRKRRSESLAWLAGAAADRWFIQLVRTDPSQAEHVEKVVTRAIDLVGTNDLRVYALKIGGERRLGVIYGDFPTLSAAAQAEAKLPAELRVLNPFPRQVRRLR